MNLPPRGLCPLTPASTLLPAGDGRTADQQGDLPQDPAEPVLGIRVQSHRHPCGSRCAPSQLGLRPHSIGVGGSHGLQLGCGDEQLPAPAAGSSEAGEAEHRGRGFLQVKRQPPGWHSSSPGQRGLGIS